MWKISHIASQASLNHSNAICPWDESDNQAADAVRSRIDGKYVLGLDLTDSGFDSSVLSEFRNRLCEIWVSEQTVRFNAVAHKRKKSDQGHLSRLWRKAHECNGNPLIEVVFDRHTCGACPVRNNCTSSAKAPRKLKLRPQAEYEALTARRIEQLSQEFKLSYASRAGIEGTISQLSINKD